MSFKIKSFVSLHGFTKGTQYNGKFAAIKSTLQEGNRYHVELIEDRIIISVKVDNMSLACNHCYESDTTKNPFELNSSVVRRITEKKRFIEFKHGLVVHQNDNDGTFIVQFEDGENLEIDNQVNLVGPFERFENGNGEIFNSTGDILISSTEFRLSSTHVIGESCFNAKLEINSMVEMFFNKSGKVDNINIDNTYDISCDEGMKIIPNIPRNQIRLQQIAVYTLTGNMYLVEIKETDLVVDIKKRICSDVGLTIEQQNFVIDGKDLRNDGSLLEYGILSRNLNLLNLDYPFDVPSLLLVEYSLKNAIESNSLDTYLDTKLHLCPFFTYDNGVGYIDIVAYSGLNGMVSSLFKRGFVSKGSDWNNQLSLVKVCAIMGNVDIMRLLISDYGAVYDFEDSSIFYASSFGHLDICRLLIESGCIKDKKSDNGKTPLMVASEEGHQSCVEFFSSIQCDIKVKDDNGDIALHLASKEGHFEICKLLIEAGCDKEVVGSLSRTALTWASFNGHLECVEYFLSIDCNMYSKDKFKKMSLHYAAEKGRIEVCNRLIAKGCDKNLQGSKNMTPLMFAVSNGNMNGVVQYLLSIGCNVDAKDTEKRTALHFASARGRDDDSIVISLLDARADVNAIDRKGNSALHLAASRSNFQIIKVLVEYGSIIVSMANRDGETALNTYWKNRSISIDDKIGNFLAEAMDEAKNSHSFKRCRVDQEE